MLTFFMILAILDCKPETTKKIFSSYETNRQWAIQMATKIFSRKPSALCFID